MIKAIDLDGKRFFSLLSTIKEMGEERMADPEVFVRKIFISGLDVKAFLRDHPGGMCLRIVATSTRTGLLKYSIISNRFVWDVMKQLVVWLTQRERRLSTCGTS
jgi:hypothetical protein